MSVPMPSRRCRPGSQRTGKAHPQGAATFCATLCAAWCAALAAAALPAVAEAGSRRQGPSISQELQQCIAGAAAYQGVPAVLLQAIAWNESRMRTDAVAHNKNGSVDLGAFQINTIHLPRLALEGIRQQHLMDGCVSSYVAAWHLRRQIDKYGYTWQAIGAYHSATPQHNERYRNQIYQTLRSWGAISDDLRPSSGAAPLQAQAGNSGKPR